MRSFPSALATTVVTTLVLTTGGILAAPPAGAIDLRGKQRELQQKIESVQAGIDDASDAAREAAETLDVATDQLGRARDKLAGLEDRVVAAVERNATLREELAASEDRLAAAEASLVQGRIEVAETRTRATDAITSVYQGAGDPGLRTFASFLSAGSLEEIETEQQAEQLIVEGQTTAYDDVQAAEDRLAATEQAVAEATEQVATQQAQAARTVARERVLRDKAVAARDRVLERVASNREARRDAIAARARDREALGELRRQEADVRRKIMAAQREAEQAGTGFTGSVTGLFSMPSSGYTTSPFGYRTHPIYGYYGLHDGTDFGAGCGAPLIAIADGTVISRTYSSVYGNRLYLSLGSINGANLTAVYNHASGYTVGVGARVARGATIGSMGDTGWSTGCHLHFTLLRDGRPVDPMSYL